MPFRNINSGTSSLNMLQLTRYGIYPSVATEIGTCLMKMKINASLSAGITQKQYPVIVTNTGMRSRLAPGRNTLHTPVKPVSKVNFFEQWFAHDLSVRQWQRQKNR